MRRTYLLVLDKKKTCVPIEMKIKLNFIAVATLIFILIMPVCYGRGGGGGRSSGRGRGRGSHSTFMRGPAKLSSYAEQRQFEWSKMGRIVGIIFGVIDPKPKAFHVAKGYQGKYVPKNVYHPSKPKPVVRADRIYEEDPHHRYVTPSSI